MFRMATVRPLIYITLKLGVTDQLPEAADASVHRGWGEDLLTAMTQAFILASDL
jgi:hypothetical protein